MIHVEFRNGMELEFTEKYLEYDLSSDWITFTAKSTSRRDTRPTLVATFPREVVLYVREVEDKEE